VTFEKVRRFALSLPETTEEPHFDKWSARVLGKIFVTAPTDGKHVHVFVDEDQTAAAIASKPAAFEELWWGKKLSGVRVVLAAADASAVFALVEMAWRRKAPRRLVASLDSRGSRTRKRAR